MVLCVTATIGVGFCVGFSFFKEALLLFGSSLALLFSVAAIYYYYGGFTTGYYVGPAELLLLSAGAKEAPTFYFTFSSIGLIAFYTAGLRSVSTNENA